MRSGAGVSRLVMLTQTKTMEKPQNRQSGKTIPAFRVVSKPGRRKIVHTDTGSSRSPSGKIRRSELRKLEAERRGGGTRSAAEFFEEDFSAS